MVEEIDEEIVEQKHSGLGIASFITSITSGILIFLLIVVAGIMESKTEGGIDEESAEAIVIGLFIVFFFGSSFVAFGLGVAGLFQKNRQKIFSILSLIFSAGAIIGTIGIMAIGFMME